MNNVVDVILSRRTAHLFDRDRAVPDAVLNTAMQCAVRAPNHKLTNPWRFRRVGEQSHAKLVELGTQLKLAKNPNLPAAMEAKIRAKLQSAPVLIIASQLLDPDERRRREDYGACACAIQNIALALWSEGVSMKWSSGAVTWDAATYEIAGIDPAEEEIIGFLWIGYADEQPETPRLPVDAVFKFVP